MKLGKKHLYTLLCCWINYDTVITCNVSLSLERLAGRKQIGYIGYAARQF